MTDDRDINGRAGLPGEPGGPPRGLVGGKGGTGGAGGKGAVGPRGRQGIPGKAPPGITQEEIDFYRAQRQADIRSALKHYTRRALVGYAILLTGLIVLWVQFSHQQSNRRTQGLAARAQIVKSGRAVSVAGCNRDFQSTLKLRAIFVASKAQTKIIFEKHQISKARYDRSIRFYSRQLRDIKLPDCRKAAEVVSQDPDKPVAVPTPLYPGGPGDTEAHPKKTG